MGKVLIIHWYGNNIDKSKKYWDLSWLDKKIESWEFDLFKRWLDTEMWLLEKINPIKQFKLYSWEKQLANTKSLQEKLYKHMKENKYDTIIAHSMWTFLFLNTLNNIWINEELKHIIFVQSDLANNIIISNQKVMEKINNSQLKIDNYYNPIDIQLIISSIIHLKVKAWLFWIRCKYIHNHFHKLWWIDRHRYSIANYKFLKSIIKWIQE